VTASTNYMQANLTREINSSARPYRIYTHKAEDTRGRKPVPIFRTCVFRIKLVFILCCTPDLTHLSTRMLNNARTDDDNCETAIRRN